MSLSTEQQIILNLILSTDIINDYVENEITFEECINEFQTIKNRLDEHYHSKANIIDADDYQRLSEFNELLTQRSFTLEFDDIPCPITEEELERQLILLLNGTSVTH